jgi:hypothetical protein
MKVGGNPPPIAYFAFPVRALDFPDAGRIAASIARAPNEPFGTLPLPLTAVAR